jgi:type IV pilus assembly protein PilE
MKNLTNQKGFTLIELMTTVLILGIIALISANIYSGYVRKGRRVDAVNSLLSMSLAEERYRSSNASYGTLAQAWNNQSTSQEGFYTLAISNVSSTAYTLTATAVGNQVNDAENGTSCSTITLSVSNGTITKSPAACWPT